MHSQYRRTFVEPLESRTLLADTPWYGAVLNQADAAMRSDVAREVFGLTGKGANVGVISDSFDFLGQYALDIASGDLPADVQVLADAKGADEGRAMLQLIHDIAPDAHLMFHTYDGTGSVDANIAQAIRDLAAAGANVIVDDVTVPAEPMFQDGLAAQAVDEVVNSGVCYFTSAGNHGALSYESNYKPSGWTIVDPLGNRVEAFDFRPGKPVDLFQSITIPRGQTIRIALQWTDPFYSVSGGQGTPTDMDIWLYDAAGNSRIGSWKDNIWSTGDPVESLVWKNKTKSTSFNLAITHYAGPDPVYIKYVILQASPGLTINEYWTPTGTLYGHANSNAAAAIGASPWYLKMALESYSSMGGTPILFDTSGNVLANADYRANPTLVAPDAVSTTVAGFSTFTGTSASAPNAAAVAALMRQAKPDATPWDIYNAMMQSAIDMDDPYTTPFDTGWDKATGSGFIQADRAVSTLLGKGSISGSVFSDTNINGRWDPKEPPKKGAIIYLDADNNGAWDTGEAFARTNRAGGYRFVGLAPGTYTLRQWPNVKNWAPTSAPGGRSVTLKAADNYDLVDFAGIVGGSISGFLFHDKDGNGVRGAKESPSWTWTMYLDSNNNGALDATEPRTETDATGAFAFYSLLPGVYHVRAVNPENDWYWTTSNTADVSVLSGRNVATPSFGMAGYSSISGSVFLDANQNGAREPGETALSACQLFIDRNNNSLWDRGEPIFKTGAAGTYAFTALPPGPYVIRLVPRKGWKLTTPAAGYHKIVVRSAMTYTQVNFGNYR